MRAGVMYALGAALLFGMATPLAKVLLRDVQPLMLAALLYLGSGLGLALVRVVRRERSALPQGTQWLWLAGAVLAGGVAGPVLLMLGLSGFSASGASLLLNSEGVLTALLAWFVFKENLNRQVALGMLVIAIGAVVLSWPTSGDVQGGSLVSASFIVLACLAWAIDNNLTRKIALLDAGFIAMSKGLAAGLVSLGLAFLSGAAVPAPDVVAKAALLGFCSYGVSLVLFVLALRHLGAARTGAYFSVAPFAGALLSVVWLGERLNGPLLAGGALMAVGVVLHLTEQHAHTHDHEPLEHDHMHSHRDDPHHEHAHLQPVEPGIRHQHRHSHLPLSHSHAHFPDAHHRHGH